MSLLGLPQQSVINWAAQKTNLLSHSSGGEKSKIMVPGGQGSFSRGCERGKKKENTDHQTPLLEIVIARVWGRAFRKGGFYFIFLQVFLVISVIRLVWETS